jgi:hypothetical protein
VLDTCCTLLLSDKEEAGLPHRVVVSLPRRIELTGGAHIEANNNKSVRMDYTFGGKPITPPTWEVPSFPDYEIILPAVAFLSTELPRSGRQGGAQRLLHAAASAGPTAAAGKTHASTRAARTGADRDTANCLAQTPRNTFCAFSQSTTCKTGPEFRHPLRATTCLELGPRAPSVERDSASVKAPVPQTPQPHAETQGRRQLGQFCSACSQEKQGRRVCTRGPCARR